MRAVKQVVSYAKELTKRIPWKRISVNENLGPGLGLAAGLAFAVAIGMTTVDAQVVYVNGKNIGIVHNPALVEKALDQVIQQQSADTGMHVEFVGKLTYKPVQISKFVLKDQVGIADKLAASEQFTTGAIGLKVGDQVVAVLKTEKEAQEALSKFKQECLAGLSEVKVISAEYDAKVELKRIDATAADVMSVDEAVQLFKQGKGTKIIHTVAEGENLWTIARENDLRVKEIMAMNPQLASEEDLNIGEEIYLSKTVPVVSLKIVAESTQKETVPFDVKILQDKNLRKGQKKVVTAGKNGEKMVTYQLTMINGEQVSKKELSNKVLTQPVQQVVAQGARQYAIVASRGGEGSIGWPLRGSVTSGFGQRWGRAHTGIDIDGSTGDPVGAAAAGRVIMAGWNGAYGKCVQVKHADGKVTLYGHLSSIAVEVGESVDKGELIGRVGNTGRSYGSHLHFEVIVGGSKRNPMKYLN